MTDFRDQTFVVVDLETTGLSPRMGDRMVEVAALKVRGLKPIERFHSLVDPQQPMPWGAYLVHHISDEMLKGAPRADAVLPRFLKFIKGSCLIGHNIKFDLGFLDQELTLAGLALPQVLPTLDTVRLAKGMLPELGSFSLQSVAWALRLEVSQQHRAMADVELTFEVFRRLLAIAERRDFADVETLGKIFGGRKVHSLKESEAALALLQESIRQTRTLTLHYVSQGHAAVTVRRVTPKKIVGKGPKQAVVGHCHLRGEERCFLLERIVRLENADEEG